MLSEPIFFDPILLCSIFFIPFCLRIVLHPLPRPAGKHCSYLNIVEKLYLLFASEPDSPVHRLNCILPLHGAVRKKDTAKESVAVSQTIYCP